MRYLWLLIFLLLLSTPAAQGGRINVTIDDYFGDSKTGSQISYLPEGAWDYGSSCLNCTTLPDAKSAHLGTWHVGMFNASGRHDAPLLFASVSFYGSAIYVYCILPSTDAPSSGYSDMTFLIDSLPAGTFTRSSFSHDVFRYNTLVFAAESLSEGSHTLVIQNGELGGTKSLVMLDYIIYSYDDIENSFQLNVNNNMTASNMTATKTASPAVDPRCAIVGGVLGSIIVLLLIIIVILYRQRTPKTAPSTEFEPKSSSIIPGEVFRRYFRRPRLLRSKTPSQLSFHPSLLVRKTFNRDRVQISRPPPSTPAHTPFPPRVSEAPHPPSTVDLIFTPSENLTSLSSPEPRCEPAQALSIVEWQRRTRMETDLVQPRLDVVNSVPLPSYYYQNPPDHPCAPEPDLPPPPRRMQRRFTVMNN